MENSNIINNNMANNRLSKYKKDSTIRKKVLDEYGLGDYTDEQLYGLGGILGTVAGGVGGALLGNPVLGASVGGSIGGLLDDNKDKQQVPQFKPQYVEPDTQLFKSGGTIHIKPENKGKFTEIKKRTGKSTEELTHSNNHLTRKRAIFAQNTKKWKHEDGGILKEGKMNINGEIDDLQDNGDFVNKFGNREQYRQGGQVNQQQNTQLTPQQAKQILQQGNINGKPLSAQQKMYLTQIIQGKGIQQNNNISQEQQTSQYQNGGDIDGDDSGTDANLGLGDIGSTLGKGLFGAAMTSIGLDMLNSHKKEKSLTPAQKRKQKLVEKWYRRGMSEDDANQWASAENKEVKYGGEVQYKPGGEIETNGVMSMTNQPTEEEIRGYYKRHLKKGGQLGDGSDNSINRILLQQVKEHGLNARQNSRALAGWRKDMVKATHNKYEDGSELATYNGAKHEDGGVTLPIGQGQQQNEVEGGETGVPTKVTGKQNTYILNDTTPIDAEQAKMFNIDKKYIGKTPANVSKRLEKFYGFRKNSPIDIDDFKEQMNKLTQVNELQLYNKQLDEMRNNPEALQQMVSQKANEEVQQNQQEQVQQPIQEQTGMEQQLEQSQQQMKYGGKLKYEDGKQLGDPPDNNGKGLLGVTSRNIIKPINNSQVYNTDKGSSDIGKIDKFGSNALTNRDGFVMFNEYGNNIDVQNTNLKVNPNITTNTVNTNNNQVQTNNIPVNKNNISNIASTELFDNNISNNEKETSNIPLGQSKTYDYTLGINNTGKDELSVINRNNDNNYNDIIKIDPNKVQVNNIGVKQDLVLPNNQQNNKSTRGNWMSESGNFLAQNAGSLFDIGRGLVGSLFPEKESYGKVIPTPVSLQKVNPNQAILNTKNTFQNAAEDAKRAGIPLSQYMNVRRGIANQESGQIGNIQSQYDNQNVGIANQRASTNAENANRTAMMNQQIGQQETIANAQNKAQNENILQAGLSNLGQNYGIYTRDQKAMGMEKWILSNGLLNSKDFGIMEGLTDKDGKVLDPTFVSIVTTKDGKKYYKTREGKVFDINNKTRILE